MTATIVKSRTITIKATLAFLSVAVLRLTTGQRHNLNSSKFSNMKVQGRTLELLVPFLGLSFNPYYQGSLNRPNGLYGNFINGLYGGGYGFGGSGSNYHYGTYPAYLNGYRPSAFGGAGFGSASRPPFQQGINYSGAVGYRPSVFGGVGFGSASRPPFQSGVNYSGAVGYRPPEPPYRRQPPGYFGYNPFYNGIGSAVNRPWNGLGGLTSSNSVEQQTLTNSQAAQLGYALANRIKPFLIAAAANSGAGVSSLTGRRRRGETETNPFNELYGRGHGGP